MIKKIADYIQAHFSTVFLVVICLGLWQPALLWPLQGYIDKLLMGALFLGCLKIEFSEFTHLKITTAARSSLSAILLVW